MDDVSGLADRSETFSSFLTVSRKFGLTCVYVLHTIYPGRQNWQMIISQTKIFNIFPSSVQANTIIGMLSSFCTRYRHNYIPKRDLWINSLYFDISNSGTKQCLTIDTRDVNGSGPTKFRTQADSNKEQICHHNRNKRDNNFNSFLPVRKQTLSATEIIFPIVNIIDKTNRNNVIYSDINDELSDFKNDNVQYKRSLRGISASGTVGETRTDGTDRQQHRNDRQSGKGQDFFQNNKPSERKYITTRIKSRNFLSSIAYVGINKEDFYSENFIFDVYLLVTKNLNPFSLDRKLGDKNEHEMIYMLWKECMPQRFYQHIFKEKNFLYLNGKNVVQPKVSVSISRAISTLFLKLTKTRKK